MKSIIRLRKETSYWTKVQYLFLLIPCDYRINSFALPVAGQKAPEVFNGMRRRSATVVGKAVIAGTTCRHLAFSRPDVDFQVWVADGDQPLPWKYVVTDKSTPELISTVTVMTEWDVSSVPPDSEFKFVPPAGAKAVTFKELDKSLDLPR